MKRFFSFFCTLIMIIGVLSLSGCFFDSKETKLSVKECLDAEYDALIENLEAAVSFQDAADYLTDWAKENQIKVKTQNDKYLVLFKPASGQEKESTQRSLTLHCPVSISDIGATAHLAATTMATLYSAENHGDLTAVFTAQVKGQPTGSSALNRKYLDSDGIVQLHYSKEAEIDPAIGASSEIQMSHKLKKTAPKYTKAYKIELEGVSYRSAYSHGGFVNPIKVIGDLLASCKSTSVLFELASFQGGEKSDLLPSHASAVIVLQENDVESFTSRFERSCERVDENYKERDESFTYKLTETALPAAVISDEDTSNIVSLMYTLTDGTYLRSDDGELIAASNIGTVTTDNNRFLMNINARSLNPAVMDEMKTIFQTTGGLCDITYQEKSSKDGWTAPKDSVLKEFLSENAQVTSGALENIDASALLEKEDNPDLVLCGLRKKNAATQIEAFLEFMSGIDTVELNTDEN